ncbi:uncharacterized protein LOC118511212 [Anopheles stephensi]|uniref:Putative ionotropic receptor ligand binding domain-containing protein n=1 Tax=Anopheles stephensi TaxID=30069 RepID=A0A182Y7K8_ANOST|nr:uncharacterized protein LOC118511212 [Anopheles stephensi]
MAVYRHHQQMFVLWLLIVKSLGGAVDDAHQQHVVERWVSCIGAIVQRHADIVRHELNAYTLSDSMAGSWFRDDLFDRLLPLVTGAAHRDNSNGGSFFTFNLARYERTVDYNQNNLVLVLMDDLQQFAAHLPALVAKNVEQRGYFLLLVVPTLGSVTEQAQIADLFRRLWDVRIHNVVLAIGYRDKDLIDLHVYDPYGPGCCECSRPKVLAQCRDGQLLNGTAPLYDRFERNLYGCQLRVACFERAPFMRFVNGGSPNNTTASSTQLSHQRLAGIEGNLVELLARHLNFRVTVVQPTDGKLWGRIYHNGSANGALGLLLGDAVHMTVGGYFPYPMLLATTTQSRNYYMTDLVLAVPEALETVSPLEQLLKPFQLTIWLVVALELVLGFAALRPYAVSLNFWRAFIGESLPGPATPRRTQTRFVLVLWIIHCTLLRECYKGSLVGYLTEATPLNDIHSLAVLLQAGYRFAMTETIYHKVFDESQYQLGEDRVRLFKPADGAALLEQTIRTGERVALAYTREEIIKFNERNRSDLNYRTSDEKLLTFHFAMYFKRSSPIAGAFDWYIRRVQATGFISRWHHENLDLRFERPTLAHNGQAEVLQVHHLLGSYLLLLAGLTIATLIFTLELLCAQRKRTQSVARNRYPYVHELTYRRIVLHGTTQPQ